MNVNDPVALIELISRTRTLGVVSAVNEETAELTVIENGTSKTIMISADGYMAVPTVDPGVVVTLRAFYQVDVATEAEIELMQRDALIAQLTATWESFITSNPTFAKVVELATLLEPFEP
jgi:hypothetical protein|tara:strand:+ start:51 stop:410 length:360 start_codon:yes stop_codon:yes gene_type:complete